MPVSTRDEILFTYANGLDAGLTKNAADAVDYANVIGSSVAAEVGGAAAIAAIQGGIAGASLMGGAAGVGTGAMAGVASAFGLGGTAGAMGTAMGLAGPVAAFGGPVGIALAVVGVGWAIYEVTKNTDDNLDDLIERLDALDPNARAKSTVDGWITTLEGFKPAMELPQTTTDVTERVKINKDKLDSLSRLVSYLKQMQRDWPMVMQNLTDWGFDPSQAKTALDKTTSTIEQAMVQVQATAKQTIKQVVQELEKNKGQHYTAVAQSILQMYQQLVKSTGKVEFDSPAEEEGFKLAQQIVADEVDPQELAEEANSMIALHTLMDQAVKAYPVAETKPAAPAAKPAAPVATSSVEEDRYISKRALTLGGKKFNTEPAAAGKSKRRMGVRNKQVEAIQTYINHLAAKYMPNSQRLGVDGIYGTLTAQAMVALLKAVPQLEDAVTKYVGVTPQYLSDYRKVSQDQRTINGLYGVLANVMNQYLGGKEQKEEGTQKPTGRGQQQGTACPYGKPGMNANEVDACLSGMRFVDPKDNVEYNMSEWLNEAGYRTPAERYSMVMEAISTGAKALPPFEEWQNRGKVIRDTVMSFQNYEQHGQGQLGNLYPSRFTLTQPTGESNDGAIAKAHKLSSRVTDEEMKKQAFAGLKDAVLHLWHPERGPFENILGLMSYLLPFIPGAGWALFIFEKFASLCDLGLADLGKHLDSKLGLGAGSNIDQAHIDEGGKVLEQLINEKMKAHAGKTQDEIVKQAFWGSLITKLIPRGFGIVMKIITMIMMAVGVDKLSDLNKTVQQEGGWAEYGTKKVMEKAMPAIQQNILPSMEKQLTDSFMGTDELTNSEDE